MPKFDVEAIEKFVVRTTYRNVVARNAKAAEKRCRDGLESYSYDSKEIEEGSEEWIGPVAITKVED